MDDIELKQHVKDILIYYHRKLDKEFEYGINRKLIYKCYKNMGLFLNKEEKVSFYRESGYYKKRN